jgi:hypothetical protein
MSTKTTPLNTVLYWTWSSTQPGSKAQRIFDENPYLDVALKWIPSCTAMLLLVSQYFDVALFHITTLLFTNI